MCDGLTAAQREALLRAVRGGYYSIPRETSTMDLAEELTIFDQAVTERLRRGSRRSSRTRTSRWKAEQQEFPLVE
ncbi:MAG: helix-turn-helix domain-containing protein [Haloarculaceae archaeon]